MTQIATNNDNFSFSEGREALIADFAYCFGKVVEKIRNTPSYISELDKYKDVVCEPIKLVSSDEEIKKEANN